MNEDIRDRIPFLNFVMMCCIIFYHCQMPWPGPAPVCDTDAVLNAVIEKSATNFASLGMTTFFTISGFLLFYGLTLKSYPGKMKRRFSTLFIPYFAWQLIYTGKGLLQGQSWSIKEWLADVFLFQFWPPLGAFWYIYALLCLAIISPIFLFLLANKKIGWITVLCSLILFYGIYQNWYRILNDERLGYLKNIVMYFPSYLIGAFYGLHYREDEALKPLFNVLLALLAALLLEGWLGGFVENTLIEILPILMLFLTPVRNWMKNRRIYQISFLMYATHQSVIGVFIDRIRALISTQTRETWLINICGRVLCILLIVSLNYLVYYIMNKLCPRILLLLTGGRSGSFSKPAETHK